MTLTHLPAAQQIRAQYAELSQQHPRLRARNAAHALGISEMELVASGSAGIQSTLLSSPPQEVFKSLSTLGRVMALTRNDWCVHERHGAYEDIRAGKTMGIVLGPDIDLRMFFKHWGSAWAVNHEGRHSIQFFDTGGTAVHKVFCTEETDMEAYTSLLARFQETSPKWPTVAPIVDKTNYATTAPSDLRRRWLAIKDVHDFYGILKDLNVSRLTALRSVGSDLAQKVDDDVVERMLQDVVDQSLPLMCFVGNPGMVQIHSGAISRLLRTGVWFNILDPEFNLHLDTSAIVQTWIVNRPSKDGWITSLECFAANGDLIVQYFGGRKPGVPERADWRQLMLNYCHEPLAA